MRNICALENVNSQSNFEDQISLRRAKSIGSDLKSSIEKKNTSNFHPHNPDNPRCIGSLKHPVLPIEAIVSKKHEHSSRNPLNLRIRVTRLVYLITCYVFDLIA